jgi:hypothetical protein
MDTVFNLEDLSRLTLAEKRQFLEEKLLITAKKDEFDAIVVMMDISGSVTDDNSFAFEAQINEITRLLEDYFTKVRIFFCGWGDCNRFKIFDHSFIDRRIVENYFLIPNSSFRRLDNGVPFHSYTMPSSPIKEGHALLKNKGFTSESRILFIITTDGDTNSRIENGLEHRVTEGLLTSVGECFSRFTRLIGLKLSDAPYVNYVRSYLHTVPSHIEELYLPTGSQLDGQSVRYMQQLKILSCVYNNGCIDTETLTHLTNLTDLEIDGHTSSLSRDSSCFLSLTKLENLKIWFAIPQLDYTNLSCLTQLREFTLYGYSKLPGCVLSGFCGLQSLSLEDNMRICDSDITTLVSLTSLSLDNCYNVDGSCISRLQSLTRLKLTNIEHLHHRYDNHFRYATNLRILSIIPNINYCREHLPRTTIFWNELCNPENYTQLQQLTYLNLPPQKVLHKDNIRELTQLPKLIFFNNELLKPVEKKKGWWWS